ncbi:MAG: MotA/TolQ/ExbB proton channel family protein, partial [Gammaproteobacteria bacterium]|nr:MotA/TolQ/ExbB proton channel family protein [Gammaproteobacteria bacterium]
MKQQLPFEFIYQATSLILAIIVVHLVYVTVIRPNADAIMTAQAERAALGGDFVPDRSIYVVLKDFEQESCFVLMFWAIAIMGYKGRNALRERSLLADDIVRVSEGMSILPEDTREYTRAIQALPEATQQFLLPRALMSALQRFASTRNVQ